MISTLCVKFQVNPSKHFKVIVRKWKIGKCGLAAILGVRKRRKNDRAHQDIISTLCAKFQVNPSKHFKVIVRKWKIGKCGLAAILDVGKR